ncbi:hypothetical protein A2U01_0098774, partial [Trifolium medium]|nr:hypothetical protein [Trifolium medium]
VEGSNSEVSTTSGSEAVRVFVFLEDILLKI